MAKQVRGQVALAAGAISRTPLGVIVLGRDGDVRFATPHALALLDRCFPRAYQASRLPGALDRWIRRHAADQARPRAAALPLGPLVLEHEDVLLVARLVTNCAERFLLLEERITSPARAISGFAGITPRERDVLVLAGLGKSHAEIARALGIGVRTVAKHMEHVYARLDVASRDAAVSRALTLLSLTQSTAPPPFETRGRRRAVRPT